MTTDGESLARQAIDAIYQDAKRAAQPHIDNLTKLAAQRAPTPMVIPPHKPGTVYLPPWIGQDFVYHPTNDARTRPDHYRAPDARRGAIERVTEQLVDAERHESRSAMINCADLRMIIEGLPK